LAVDRLLPPLFFGSRKSLSEARDLRDKSGGRTILAQFAQNPVSLLLKTAFFLLVDLATKAFL
jgi:hypothetical protein